MNKANVNASTHTGTTALYIAGQNGHVDVVKTLLANNADVKASMHTDGSTALYIAAQKGHVDVVRTLLANNADINASMHTDGATVLYIAAQNGHVDVVKTLLEYKADVNARLKGLFGEKLIDAARRNNHSEIVKLLK